MRRAPISTQHVTVRRAPWVLACSGLLTSTSLCPFGTVWTVYTHCIHLPANVLPLVEVMLRQVLLQVVEASIGVGDLHKGPLWLLYAELWLFAK